MAKYHPNRHAFKGDSEYVSTSAKNFKTPELKCDRDVDMLILFHAFFAVFTALSEFGGCKKCNSDVRFSQSSKRGLGFKILVSCSNCGDADIFNCPLIHNNALGLTVGPNMHEFCVRSDANRVKVAEHRMPDIAKESRCSLTSDKKGRRGK